MPTIEPDHIIAIGASAGGMEEINAFFDHTPLDGVSYIIIQHLSPDFKSRMVELLARHSKLVVKEAENGAKVKRNQVYLIPSNKFMTIQDNKLFLTDKLKKAGPHLTINTFFNSLAVNSGKKSIAIVLSGLGSDGTEGIKAIKKAGGMVIARNPETSEFNSMPSHAVATGIVDFILEPELMPGAIEDYVKYEAGLLVNDPGDQKNLIAIINLIKENSPLDFSDYKQATILRRTKRRAAYHNFTSLSNYMDFLKTTPEEVTALAKEFLISVTSFFRDKEAFDFIQSNVLPEILKKLAPREELKLWVAGCATGEEVYSLAILIAEQLTGKFKDTVVKIFATDIDNAALVLAAKGIYSSVIEKDVSPRRIERYFLKEGQNYRIKPEIRKMAVFAQHDLVKNPPYCNMHLISCRNLLIYMTPTLQKKIFNMLLFGLKMEGYLFLGSSENPMPIIEKLEVTNKKWKIYRNLETKRAISFDAFSLPNLLDLKHMSSSSAREPIGKNMTNVIAETMNDRLAEVLNFMAVCIDENDSVIKSYGDTTKYLLQKHFTSNLAELLPKPLLVAFNTLSKTVSKTNESTTVYGIKIKRGQSTVKVSLSVTPLVVKKGEQRLLMVVISDANPVGPGSEEDYVYDEKTYLNQYTLNLEAELKELKDKLHSAYEKLDSSAENLQSFNEELISANEEMQSTNEEMQSVNEELHTINSDYQLKNKELLDVNDDLNNYFRSNINGQLFIDNNLLLMKFSPGTVKQINLRDSDIGRPISNISTNIKFETIIEDIKQVIDRGSVITKEIETNNGKWYQIMTMPYIQQTDHKSKGAIVTFNDITELKKTQLELDKKNESLLRINADLDNFANTASHDLLAPLGSLEMSIGVMNRKVTDPELNKFLIIINSSVKKFRELISDISTIAKLESDMMEMVDLEEIIKNVEWSLDLNIKLSGAVITKNLGVKQVFFSKKNLRSILFNLISNGIKFQSDKHPVIHIHTSMEENDIILTVEDNGRGMPAEGLNRIFDMYGRLHQDIDGRGIGLYLAKKIVNAAGGSINVESKPDKGSKFIIHFKCKKEDHLRSVT
ncbi:chemotaxis protein CheB [Pedobacter cryoconitis]|uniref:histidine kinase n=1 Tax=Pedobacter cryoconitis TaxID=188932 RepID=A0A7X0J7P0_9SPHI|nr:chemotaxis protein CheB [Pedobacter cryoconitis]MBB6502619.1 two-component system CheB/CheR fusion protein [Pedobacter cryoconitis]